MCSCCALPAISTSACVRKSYKVNPSSTLQPRPLILWYLAARIFSAAAANQHRVLAPPVCMRSITWAPSLCSHVPALLHCYHNGGHTPRQPAYRCSGPDAPPSALPSPSRGCAVFIEDRRGWVLACRLYVLSTIENPLGCHVIKINLHLKL